MSSRERKQKKLLMKIGIIIAVIALIVVVVILVKRGGKKGGEGSQEEENQSYALPDTTYSDMQVSDISMEYLSGNDETMVTMIISNTSNRTVNQESLKAILIDDKGEILGQTTTYIENLEVGEQYSISVIMKGDLTSTTQVSLQEIQPKTQETEPTEPVENTTNTANTTNETEEDDEEE